VCTSCYTQKVPVTRPKEVVPALEKTVKEKIHHCGKCGAQRASYTATCPKCFSYKLISY